MKRQGHTYRIHDRVLGLPLTLAFDPEARGGTYSPEVYAYWRRGRGYIGGYTLRLRLPVIGWARAWQLRRLGARRLYRIEAWFIYRAFDGRER